MTIDAGPSAPLQGAADRPVELVEAAPGVGGLEGLDEHAEPEQLVAQVGALVAAVLPGAPGGAAERHRSAGAQPPRRASGGGATDSRSPSQPQIIRQPPRRRRSAR